MKKLKTYTIQNKKEYKILLRTLNGLIDIVGGNENHDLVGTLEIIGNLIWEYENKYHPLDCMIKKEK